MLLNVEAVMSRAYQIDVTFNLGVLVVKLRFS